MKTLDEMLIEAAEKLSDYGAIIVPEMILETIEQHSDLKQELLNDSYMDTNIREKFLSTIAENVIGMRWPTYGDDKEYQNEFLHKAVTIGFIRPQN